MVAVESGGKVNVDEGWSTTAPEENGPYWVWQAGQPPFAAFISRRSPDPLVTGRKLTSVDGHALRVEDRRYSWHPWQAKPPAPPEIEPGAGAWGNRPWRGGLHRVTGSVGHPVPPGHCGTFTLDMYVVICGPRGSGWSRWRVAEIGEVRYPLTGCCGDIGGGKARWYRYPDPPEDKEGVK